MAKIPLPHKILTGLLALAAAVVPVLLQVCTGDSHAQLSTPAAILAIAGVIAHGLSSRLPPPQTGAQNMNHHAL